MKKLKITWNAPVVLGFALVSLIAMVLKIVTGGVSNTLLFSTYRSSLLSPLTWLRFFTHILGHSGWTHYIGNMSYLLLLGPALEEKYGWKRILGIMAVTAVITGAVNSLLFPHTALCGASGVVFAFILLSSITQISRGEIPLTFLLVAVLYIGRQLYEGVFTHDNVSQITHIIGGGVGTALGFYMNAKEKKADR